MGRVPVSGESVAESMEPTRASRSPDSSTMPSRQSAGSIAALAYRVPVAPDGSFTRNADLLGMGFALGDEDAVYLVGRVPVSRVDDYELDRIVGASLAYTDECFPTAMTLGYEGRYRRRPQSQR